jgi:hypothetical protein
MKVKIMKDLINNQNLIFKMGECFLFFLEGLMGIKNKINKDITKATTPPNFDGTERKIV